MLVHFAHRILDMTHSIESYLGAYGNPIEWKEQDVSFVSDDAWNEESDRQAQGTEAFQKWSAYLERLREFDATDFSDAYNLIAGPSPPTWNLIEDPDIEELILPKNNWRVPQKLIDEVWVESNSESKEKCDDVLWRMSNACKNANHAVTADTVKNGTLYIPSGLSVFKPLAPELFGDACKELYQLYMDEDMKPSKFFSPDRTHSRVMPRKTMLIYTIKRTESRDGVEYLYPQQTIADTLKVLRARGYAKLAEFAENHVHALIKLTRASYDDVKTTGGIMFLRYAPGEGFRPHIDGTAGLGHSPGPILNVTMGIHGEKVLDMMPSACWSDAKKKPIRIRTKPGESILMWKESRVAWTHCIPEGDETWRYTMAIKLPLRDRDFEIESVGLVADYPYKNYKFDLTDVRTVRNSANTLDAEIPGDLTPVSNFVRFDESCGQWKYILPPRIQEVVYDFQTRPLFSGGGSSASNSSGSGRGGGRGGISNPMNRGRHGNQISREDGRGQIQGGRGHNGASRGRGR